MHGRKKQTLPPSSAEIDNANKKIVTYKTFVKLLFQRKSTGLLDQETLQLSSKMLLSSPDFYSIWNLRRCILIHLYAENGLSNIPNSRIRADEIRDVELTLSADCIRKNPKSYGAWHHRKWILERFEVDYNSELELCRQFLLADQRNFHCWSYRQFVVRLAGDNEDRELDFSQEKIFENFSNYSAFHHRSVYLQKLDKSSSDFVAILEGEFSIIENAIYTEPDDQSAWWYQNFLLVLASHLYPPSSHGDYLSTLIGKQLKLVSELLEVEGEGGGKWALSSLVNLIPLLVRVRNQEKEISSENQRTPSDCDPSELSIEYLPSDSLSERRRAYLTRLIEIDPKHKNRYIYLLQSDD